MVSASTYVRNININYTQIDSSNQTLLFKRRFFGPHWGFDSTEPSRSGVKALSTRWIVAAQPHRHLRAISTSHRYVLNSQELPRKSVMIYYWMVNRQKARLRIDTVRALREWTLYAEPAASSQRNSKRAKVTTCELQWSHLSCCSTPVWAPGDHSHPDQWSRSPRSCQSACRPRKTTRRWLEEAEWQQKSVIPPRISPRSSDFLPPVSTDCTASLFMKFFISCCFSWWHMFLLLL